MIRFLRQILLVILCLSVSMLPIQVYASSGLDNALTTMFTNSSSHASLYSSPTRSGFFLGNFNLQSPTKAVQLFNFDPPRIEAGCGGISLHMGSFTFINKAQFTAMLRAIVGSAVGYFFKIALSSICGHCSAAMADLANTMNHMTMNNLNSCKIGQAIANGPMTAFTDATAAFSKDKTNLINSAQGAYDDIVDSFMGQQSNQPAALNTAAQDLSTSGNPTYTLLMSKNGGSIGSIMPSDVNMPMYIMTMSGFTIFDPNDVEDSSNESGLTCDSGNCGASSHDRWGNMTLDSFLEGNPNPNALPTDQGTLTFDQCIDTTQCITTKKATVAWGGADNFVLTMMYGGTDLTQPPSANSILGELEAGTALTASQMQFLQASGTNIVSVIREVQGDPTAMFIAMRICLPFLQAEYKYMLVHAILADINMLLSDNTVVNQYYQAMNDGSNDQKPATPQLVTFRDTLLQKEKELREKVKDKSIEEILQTTTDFIKMARKNNPNVIALKHYN